MTTPQRRAVRLDSDLLYRTVKSVAAFRGVTLAQAATEAGVPVSTIKKMSGRRDKTYNPSADNLLRLLVWMNETDATAYAVGDEGGEDDA